MTKPVAVASASRCWWGRASVAVAPMAIRSREGRGSVRGWGGCGRSGSVECTVPNRSKPASSRGAGRPHSKPCACASHATATNEYIALHWAIRCQSQRRVTASIEGVRVRTRPSKRPRTPPPTASIHIKHAHDSRPSTTWPPHALRVVRTRDEQLRREAPKRSPRRRRGGSHKPTRGGVTRQQLSARCQTPDDAPVITTRGAFLTPAPP